MTSISNNNILEQYIFPLRGFINSGVNPAIFTRAINVPFIPDALEVRDLMATSSAGVDYHYSIKCDLPLRGGTEQDLLSISVGLAIGIITNSDFSNFFLLSDKPINGTYNFSFYDNNNVPMPYAGNFQVYLRFIKFKD